MNVPAEEVEVATRGRAYLATLAGRRVTVVGLARSGIAAARLRPPFRAPASGGDGERVLGKFFMATAEKPAVDAGVSLGSEI